MNIRLLEAMQQRYPKLTDVEVHTEPNGGAIVLFVSDDHTLYPSLEALYGKKKEPAGTHLLPLCPLLRLLGSDL
jgi:5'-3' exonuclease